MILIQTKFRDHKCLQMRWACLLEDTCTLTPTLKIKSPALNLNRCRVNMAHTRQSKQDSGLICQANVLNTFEGVPSSLGSGPYPPIAVEREGTNLINARQFFKSGWLYFSQTGVTLTYIQSRQSRTTENRRTHKSVNVDARR